MLVCSSQHAGLIRMFLRQTSRRFNRLIPPVFFFFFLCLFHHSIVRCRNVESFIPTRPCGLKMLPGVRIPLHILFPPVMLLFFLFLLCWLAAESKTQSAETKVGRVGGAGALTSGKGLQHYSKLISSTSDVMK